MDSKEYWKKRETENLVKNLKTEAEYTKELNSQYDYMMDQAQKEINGFYVKYATKEGITMAEAKKRVSKLDIEEYGRKAAKYVKDKDLSAQANEEMRLYNATMKINRLEMLKANIGLEMVVGFDELQKFFDEKLTDRTIEEFERQAGILGNTIQNNAQMAHAIVNASFNNARYSDRVWMYQGMMKSELSKLLQIGLIQGKNPRELARHLTKLFGVQKSNAERLMRTELSRVQTEAQRQSFERNGYEQYEFIALGNACDVCRALNGKHFDVKKMMPGENAPPMHPNCVLPDTKIIAPDIEAMTRSEYSGNVVEIRTANGTRLTVTANHIMLTTRGWVRAKNIVNGDKVIHYCGGVESVVKPDPADNNSIPTAEELFTSLIEASPMSSFRVPVTAEDFKGDVIPKSKVDIVFIDSKLRDKLNTTTRKLISDVLLVGATEIDKRKLPRSGSLAEFLVGIGLAADGIMSSLCVANILRMGSLTHGELIGLREPSDYDLRLEKTVSYNRSTDTECFSDSIFATSAGVHRDDSINIDATLNGHRFVSNRMGRSYDRFDTSSVNIGDFVCSFPGLVELDDVVFVSDYFFSGHVYDASSLSTLYICNGLVSSNCRCSTSAYMDREKFDKWLESQGKGDIINTGAKKTSGWKDRHAELEYESIRKRTTDCEKISNNAGISLEDVKTIKAHMFNEKHKFKDGSVRRFDADFEQTQAWDRLSRGKHKDIDVLLLRHELEESKIMCERGLVYEDAHELANLKYNWWKAFLKEE